jgi:hypothetical protein
MQRTFALTSVGSLALSASAFLPWLRIGNVGLSGIPDPAGYFILVVGVIGVALSLAGAFLRRRTQAALALAGLAGVTTLCVVWVNGPGIVADRAQARAEAVALVDNVPVAPVPPVRVGAGLLLGLAGAGLTAAAALISVSSRPDA